MDSPRGSNRSSRRRARSCRTSLSPRSSCRTIISITRRVCVKPSRPAPHFPDDLAKSGKTLNFIPVDDHLRLADATMTMDLYHVIANNHMADGVFAYIPEHKMMIEGDIATAAEDLQWWGDSWLDNIAYRKIDVQRNVPVHMTPMTRDEVVKMVNGGIERVKQFCADHVAKGDYFPGCPAQVR